MAEDKRATLRSRRRPPEAPVPADLAAELEATANRLIQENRRLKRELDRLSKSPAGSADGALQRGLRALQRRVLRAVEPEPAGRRRRPGAG